MDFLSLIPLYAPASVFSRRRGRSPWLLLLVLTLVLVALFGVWQQALGPVMEAETHRAMAGAAAEGEGMSPEQAEQMLAMNRIFGLVGFGLGFPLTVLLVALVTWGLALAFGAAASYTTVLLVVTYAQVVRILQYGAGVIQGVLLDVNRLDSVHDVSLGLARFLDQPDTAALTLGLASRVELFSLWTTALVATGLHVTTRLSRGAAWTVALLVWILGALPAVLGAAFAG